MNPVKNLKFIYKYDNLKDISKKWNIYNDKLSKKKSQKKFQLNKNKLPKLDKNNYHKALINKCGLKKSKSIYDFQKISYPKKNSLGPYNNLFNGGGGFCKRIGNYNYKDYSGLNMNNEELDKNMHIYVYKPNIEAKYKKYNDFGNKGKTNKSSNYIAPFNNQRYNNSSRNLLISNNKNKINKSNKEQSSKGKNYKLNINEVFKNIKYLQLDKENINDDNQKKENNENEKHNNYKSKLINNQEKNFENKAVYFNESSTKTVPNIEIKKNNSNRILVKQINEQFSMKNNQIKKFNKLIEVDNVLLNYFPSFNNQIRNNLNTKSSFNNFSISSNQIEYNISLESKPKTTLILEGNKKDKLYKNEKTQTYSNLNISQDNRNKIKEEYNNENIEEEKNINTIFNNNKGISNNVDFLNKIVSFNEKNNKDKNNTFENNNIKNSNINKNINNIKNINNNINKDTNNNINNNINKEIHNCINNNFTNNINYNINKDINNNINEDVNIHINNNINNDKNINIYNIDNNIVYNMNNINNNINVAIKDNNIYNNNINKETDNKIKEENNENKEEEKILESKNSKQFMKFKSRLIKKMKSDFQKKEDKYFISSKISNLASELENKFKKRKSVKIQENNKQEIEKKLNSMEIIEQKPINLNKKKSKKINFDYN